MSQRFYVKDYLKDTLSHSDAIEACLKAATAVSGEKTIVFDGQDYWIDRAIILCADTHVIIDNCSICQKDEVFDNIFRGGNYEIDPENPYGFLLSVSPIHNISIKGSGTAKLVGTGKPVIGFHPVLNEYQYQNGDFWGWRTHMLSFSLCDGFELSGLDMSQTMGWAVCFDHCCNVHVRDLSFFSTVKNGDGVNFRTGCHHCSVKNITGYTADDSVACTSHFPSHRLSYPRKNYLYPSEPYSSIYPEDNGDIHDVTISDVHTGGLHHGVICLAAEGNKVYNINIENISETDKGHRASTVKVYTGYGDNYTPGDLHHIVVKNVTSQIAKATFEFGAEGADVKTENLVQNNPDGILVKNM